MKEHKAKKEKKKEPKHKDMKQDKKLVDAMVKSDCMKRKKQPIMNMLYDATKDKAKGKSMESPYNKRERKDDKKAYKAVEKSVKPVAKDTNKTRRKMEKPTAEGKKSFKPGNPMPKQRKKDC